MLIDIHKIFLIYFQHEESLTSSEFEKFLAERAAAAEMLPSTTDNTSTHGRIKKEEDPMFTL